MIDIDSQAHPDPVWIGPTAMTLSECQMSIEFSKKRPGAIEGKKVESVLTNHEDVIVAE